MPDSISTVVASVQRRMPDLTTSRAIELANLVHQELFIHLPEIRRTPHSAPVTVTVLNGVKEYVIPENLAQVDYVHLGSNKLMETNVETLNKTYTNWRFAANALPLQFYITADSQGRGVIGLHPTPNAGGTLNVYGSTRENAALTGVSSVPETLPNSQVYVEGVSYYASLELRPGAAASFKATYMEQIALAKEYVRTRSDGLKKPPFVNERGDV